MITIFIAFDGIKGCVSADIFSWTAVKLRVKKRNFFEGLRTHYIYQNR